MSDAKGLGPSRAWTFVKDLLLIAVVLVVATGLAFAVSNLDRPAAQVAFDFSLAVVPPSRSVAPGNSTTANVTATALSSSTRDVQFSCRDLPPGASCSFTPSSCSPTCHADLLLSTSASTPIGAHFVTLVASDGTIFRSTPFSVDLSAPSPPPPPPFNFSLSVDPASGSVPSGGDTSTNVTATLISGSTHAIQFSCSNLPSNTMCTFVRSSCSPTCAAGLTIATSANTPAGAFAINVTASDGSVARTASYSLTVRNAEIVTTLTFQKGDGGVYSETDDATLYSGNPNGTYGTDTLFIVDKGNCIANGSECRSVLSFPVFIGPNAGQVPAKSSILSAMIEFNVSNDGPLQHLYQVSEAWKEATVTWNSFATPGTPRTKGPTVQYNATFGRIVVNITGIVQNWVNGDPNRGVFIRSDSWNGAQYYSSESARPPKLIVTFRSAAAALRHSTDHHAGTTGTSGSRDSRPPLPESASIYANAIPTLELPAPREFRGPGDSDSSGPAGVFMGAGGRLT